MSEDVFPTCACENLTPDNLWRVTYTVHFGGKRVGHFCRCLENREKAEEFMKGLTGKMLGNVKLSRYARLAVE